MIFLFPTLFLIFNPFQYNFSATRISPALIYFGRERGWWITCNYLTVLKEKNINRNGKSTTCAICWLKSDIMIFLFPTLFLIFNSFQSNFSAIRISPALIYFGRERGWWITCNYLTVLKEKNINKNGKSTTCAICWLKSDIMIFLFPTLFLM
jgi:hypothetical protein